LSRRHLSDHRQAAAATSGVTDIVAVARDDAHFDTLLDRRFDDCGPRLFAVKIDDAPGQGQTPGDPALIRSRFMKGSAPAAAADWRHNGAQNGRPVAVISEKIRLSERFTKHLALHLSRSRGWDYAQSPFAAS
jgi:hypothetical protein